MLEQSKDGRGQGGQRGAGPQFVHRDKVIEAFDHLFSIFQMPDPEERRCLFSSFLVENATVLLTGTYGTGKTQLVHLIRKIFFSDGKGEFLYDYETCHQELTAFDVLYHLDLAELQQGREVVHPKAMVTARLKFLNEIQRAGTGFFNALLPMLAERRITYRDAEFEVPDFLCIMDRNPHDSGSSEIPEAFLDRIDYSFEVTAVNLDNLLNLQHLRRTSEGYHWGDLQVLAREILTFHELAEVWQDVKRVEIPRRSTLMAGMLTDALRLCVKTDRSTAGPEYDLECDNCQFYGEVCSHLLKVPGMRLTQGILRLAQALAWLEGHREVSDSDVLAALPWSLAHRLTLRPEELRKQPSPLAWVRQVALSEILLKKIHRGDSNDDPIWIRALKAFEKGEQEALAKLSGNDLVIAELLDMTNSEKRV